MAPCRNCTYLTYERFLARLHHIKSLRILFSEYPVWESSIKQGFHGLRHDLVFGPIEVVSPAEFDVVVPIDISDLIQARKRPELMAKNPIPIPSEESISRCNDKFKFNQAVIDGGFGSYIPEIIKGVGPPYPYMLKKRISCWGKDCHIIRDRHDEWRFRDQISDPAYFCQRIVPGAYEYATHILFTKGRIVKSLNIMYVFESEVPIKGQDGWLYTVIHHCPYLDLFSNVLRSIDFQGLCCVNYKVERGKPEIVPSLVET